MCEQILRFNIGVISGSDIFEHKHSPKLRAKTVKLLNEAPFSDMAGLVVTAQTGGVGFNIPSASLMLFMGSMYSFEKESQAVCEDPDRFVADAVVARMCRPGQDGLPKAYMITNPAFKGDMAAIALKAARGEELKNLTDFLTPDDIEELAQAEEVKRLLELRRIKFR